MAGRIGLFGGAFDPPHNGHRAVAESLVASGLIDRLWILPTAWPPHKQAPTAPFPQRVEMCRYAFAGISGADIHEIEAELPAPSFFIHTLDHLMREYPEIGFVLCLGSDSLHNLPKWYRWTDILRKADVLVAERPGFPVTLPDALKPFEGGIRLLGHAPVAADSTSIRNGEASAADLPPRVARYIALNRLYGS